MEFPCRVIKLPNRRSLSLSSPPILTGQVLISYAVFFTNSYLFILTSSAENSVFLLNVSNACLLLLFMWALDELWTPDWFDVK